MKYIKTFEGFFDKVSNFIRPKSNKDILKEFAENYEKVYLSLFRKYDGTDIKINTIFSTDVDMHIKSGHPDPYRGFNPNKDGNDRYFTIQFDIDDRIFIEINCYYNKGYRPVLSFIIKDTLSESNKTYKSFDRSMDILKKSLKKLGFVEKHYAISKDYFLDNESVNKIIDDLIYCIDNIEESLFQSLHGVKLDK